LPGKYLFEAYQQTTNSLDAHVVAAARRTVEVGTEAVNGIELNMSPTFDIAGSVAFDRGCAAVPLWVMLQGDFAQDVHAGPGGQFLLTHLIQGKYRVFVKPEIPTNVFASSAQIGDAEVLTEGFEATASTKGPLRITMNCGN
jgi:hypothetical protein